MKRSENLQKFVDAFTKKSFGRTISDPVCVTCGSDKIKPEDFRDNLSIKEFNISHMYQKCQDSVFGGDDHE